MSLYHRNLRVMSAAQESYDYASPPEGPELTECDACDGAGYIWDTFYSPPLRVSCSSCDGTGFYQEDA